MEGRCAWGGRLLITVGMMMIYVSMADDLRLFNELDGPERTVPAVSIGLSVWIIISARLRGRKLARWLHDLDVLSRHGLTRRHSLLGKPLGLAAGLLVSTVVILSIALFVLKILSLLVLGLFMTSILGSALAAMIALLSGPAMLVGWYGVDRMRVDTTCSDHPVTRTGIGMMWTLDAVETGERKATNAVVSTLDATQATLRYAGKMIRKGRR